MTIERILALDAHQMEMYYEICNVAFHFSFTVRLVQGAGFQRDEREGL